jgi:hypothetical protein
VQHDILEDKSDQDHQRLRINAQEATDLIKILHGLEGKILDIFLDNRSPMKLRFQQMKNQDNRRFLQAVMPKSPSATRPEISFGEHAALK